MKSNLIAIRYIVPTLLAFQAAGAQVREPTVARSSIWMDTVKRGDMVRQVRGLGQRAQNPLNFIRSNQRLRFEAPLQGQEWLFEQTPG